jgi:hypothetical protein
MPKASKTTATDSMVIDGDEGHFENFDGGYTVGFETDTADADLTPSFSGVSRRERSSPVAQRRLESSAEVERGKRSVSNGRSPSGWPQ